MAATIWEEALREGMVLSCRVSALAVDCEPEGPIRLEAGAVCR